MLIEKTVLDNGICVVTERMPASRSAALGFWVLTGSVDEQPGEEGLSHFMEHMLFKGTPTRSAIEISMAFDALGAELNAFTSKEHTCFYARMMDKNLAPCFEILADMLVNSAFAPDTVEPEREVVLEEIASSEDIPDDYVYELFGAALFDNSPLGKPVLGSRETVSAFSSEDLRHYHERNYVTGNLAVVACGNVDHNQVVELAQRCLAGLIEGPRRNRERFTVLPAKRLASLSREGEQAHIVMGCPAPSADSPARFAHQIVDSALGGTMSSRLFNEIREKRGLVYSVYSVSQLYGGVGQFEVYAGTRPDNIEQVVTVAREQLELMAREGIGVEELARVREMVCGIYVLSMESPHNHMVRLGKMICNGLELTSIDSTIEAYRSITLEEVNDAAKRLLEQELTVAVISPYDKEAIERMVL